MFVNKLFTYLTCFNLKSSTCYFHVKTKILADFQIYVNVPLTIFAKGSNLDFKLWFLNTILVSIFLFTDRYEDTRRIKDKREWEMRINGNGNAQTIAHMFLFSLCKRNCNDQI